MKKSVVKPELDAGHVFYDLVIRPSLAYWPPDQPLGDATRNNTFEKLPEKIALPEPPIPVLRER